MSVAIRINEFIAAKQPQLQGWNGKSGLVCLVAEAIAEVPWENKTGTFGIRAGERFPSILLMTLLTFCYATGTYGSQDIQRATLQNEALRGLFAGDSPDWQTIRRYRRLHREGLRNCLIHVVRQALFIRFGDADTEPPLADHYVAVALDRWFDPLCVPSPGTEAANRIERAVIHDEVLFD